MTALDAPILVLGHVVLALFLAFLILQILALFFDTMDLPEFWIPALALGALISFGIGYA